LANSSCVQWKGRKTSRGYGQITIKGRTVYAHRRIFELLYGPIPKGSVVMHKCDNPSCVNPDHLILGTQVDNMRDMIAKKRSAYFGVRRYGEDHPAALLRWTDVAWMRYLRAQGFTQQRISELVGGSRRNVATVCSGRTWPKSMSTEVSHR